MTATDQALAYRALADEGDPEAQNEYAICLGDGRGVQKDDAEAARYYKMAADQGNARGQCNYGYCLKNGCGTKKDDEQAAKYYKMAAEQNDMRGQYNYGACLENGEGVEKDETEAVRYYKMAADQGHMSAQYDYGYCAANGIGIAKDDVVAAQYYKMAAERNDTRGQYSYGYCLENGQGVEKDETEAVRYYKMAADQGHMSAQYDYGYCAANGIGIVKDDAVAAQYYKMAGDQGDVRGQYSYGYCLENGEGVEKDETEAVRYYKMAADEGYVKAQCCYASCLRDGGGVQENQSEAVRYYKMAADGGSVVAQCCYGVHLENGKGVDVNETEAVRYYKMAAAEGYATAQCNYGLCLDDGRGVQKDEAKAVEYYKMAADQDIAIAQYKYAVCLENGRHVPKDVMEAVRYYKLAADQGEFRAGQRLESLVGERDAKKVDENEIPESVLEMVIDLKEWEFVERLGNGQFGVVELFREISTGDLAAVKTLNVGSRNVYNMFMREAELMLCANHPCVLPIRGIVPPISDASPRIFSAFMDCESVDSMLWGSNSDIFNHTHASIIAVGIAFGMRYIHSLHIIHQDLKPANVLLDQNHYPRIGDFGSGTLQNAGVVEVEALGTPAYMAPEMYDNKIECGGYTEMVDVFSFGVILYELVFRRRGFTGMPMQIMKKSIEGERESVDVERCAAAFGVNPVVTDLIVNCWSVNHEDRPTFWEIVDIFASIDFRLFDDVDNEEVSTFVQMVRRNDAVKILYRK